MLYILFIVLLLIFFEMMESTVSNWWLRILLKFLTNVEAEKGSCMYIWTWILIFSVHSFELDMYVPEESIKSLVEQDGE